MSAGLNSVVSISYPTPGELIAAGAALPVVGLGTIGLRYFVRVSRKSPFGLDDWLLIPALLAVIGMGATIITGVKKRALGYPSPPPDTTSVQDLLTEHDPLTILSEKLDFIISICTIFAYCFIKLSILFLYRRIFVVSGHSKLFDIATWTLIAIVISWTIAFVFLFIFNCGSHVTAQWGTRADLLQFCGAGLKHQEALYVSEFVTNVLLVVAPIPSIFSLSLKTHVKFQVLGILLLAFVAFAASIVRLILMFQVVDTTTYGDNFDINQTNSTIFYWSMMEAGIALIACCLPILKPLVSDRGLGSAIASIRSVLSLQSVRSGVSQSSKAGPTTMETNGTYTKMDREGSLAAPLKEEHIEMKSFGSRDPSGEHAV